MQKVLATVRHGQVALDAPIEWPEGTRLEVRVLARSNGRGADGGAVPNVRPEFLNALNNPVSLGLDERWWPLSDNEARLLVDHMKAAEPLEFSPDEEQRWEADLAASKQLQKELVRKSWEDSDRLFP